MAVAQSSTVGAASESTATGMRRRRSGLLNRVLELARGRRPIPLTSRDGSRVQASRNGDPPLRRAADRTTPPRRSESTARGGGQVSHRSRPRTSYSPTGGPSGSGEAISSVHRHYQTCGWAGQTTAWREEEARPGRLRSRANGHARPSAATRARPSNDGSSALTITET
jgi:hypothetical protein